MRNRSRILKVLQARFPNEVWHCERQGFGWEYTTDSGWFAGWRSVLAPKYPDDDESCENRFYVYPKGQQPFCLMMYNGKVVNIE